MESKMTRFKLALVMVLLASVLAGSSLFGQPARAVEDDPNCDDPDGFAACVRLGFGVHNCYDTFCKVI